MVEMQKGDVKMNYFSKIAVKITALVAVIMFFFPLCSVSCSNTDIIEFTGIELAMGKTIDMPDLGIEVGEAPEKLEGSPIVIAAIVLAAIALICALLLGVSRIFGVVTVASSILSLAIMILVMVGMRKKVMEEVGEFATVKLHIPYYILLISLGASAVMGFISAGWRDR